MEMFGKTLCVTYDELVGSGIMSKSNYKNMFVRKVCSLAKRRQRA